jgi:hypothetical protein
MVRVAVSEAVSSFWFRRNSSRFSGFETGN